MFGTFRGLEEKRACLALMDWAENVLRRVPRIFTNGRCGWTAMQMIETVLYPIVLA